MDSRIHISLEVSDLDNSVAFYSRLFRHAPTKLKSDYANFRLESPQLHLALVHNPSRGVEPQSNRHYGVELFADERLKIWLESARTSGLQTRIEDQTTCCYAVADKFWARDPDGHEWEFWVRHGEAETMHEAKTERVASDDSACCAPQAIAAPAEQSPSERCCAPGKC